jgi:hypothetical protein
MAILPVTEYARDLSGIQLQPQFRVTYVTAVFGMLKTIFRR